MTVTTTKLQDYLGRWLVNATPGTSAATDFLGRHVTASDHDFLGRSGNTIYLSDGAVLQCSVAGTSGASAPLPPGLGETVVDASVTWLQLSEPTSPPAWQATHAYLLDAYVVLSGGALLQCAHAGTSAGTAPTAPGLGQTVVDGTVTWEQVPLP
jgi:hypothetical protein